METDPVVKTARMKLTEYQFGKPIEQVIAELYAEFGNHNAVANRLGISTMSLHDWRRRLGVEVKRSFRYSVVE